MSVVGGRAATTLPIASLDVDTGAEATWDAVADQCEQELQAGTAEAVPLELVLVRLEARFLG